MLHHSYIDSERETVALKKLHLSNSVKGFPNCELNCFNVRDTAILFSYLKYLDELPICCALTGFEKLFLLFRKHLH